MRVRHITALVGCLAYLLGACATGTPEPTPTPQAVVEPPSITRTEHTLGAGSGWPDGTKGLRTVVFRITVSGDAEQVLSSGGKGNLVIKSVTTNQWAKLVFVNGVKAAYEMPAEGFTIKEFGPFICHGAFFLVPVGTDAEAQIEFDLQLSADQEELELSRLRKVSDEKGTTTIRRTSVCLTGTALAAWDKQFADKPSTRRPTGSSGDEKVALTVLKVIVLAPLVVLGGLSGSVSFGN